ncbi:1-aminocyclopropane-1-carboxylate deaminase/D-cysteine desulfhydrase [Stagnimonas aquatica]|nr:pyridoxal-phosphate dependent enzyme [Stagnimonas aquatica]
MSAYPLFDAHPRLAALPRAGIFQTPTAVRALPGYDGAWVKRDDLSNSEFGGNKIRKLDLLLGEAQAQRRRCLLAFGYSGSNFVAASAWHGRRLGLDTIGLLLPQAGAPYVADNLATCAAAGAELALGQSSAGLVSQALARSLRRLATQGRWPYWMPPGGSTPLGALGFVNAAYELRAQIEAGLCPEPERITVAFSSMGTVAGLAIGLALAGLRSRVVAVQVVSTQFATPAKLDRLIAQTQALLRRYDPAIPTRAAAVEIRTEFYGQDYAVPTAATTAAMQAFQQASGARGDSAYSGKALAGYYADLQRGLPGPSLYWHTFNAERRPRGVSPLPPERLRGYLLGDRC